MHACDHCHVHFSSHTAVASALTHFATSLCATSTHLLSTTRHCYHIPPQSAYPAGPPAALSKYLDKMIDSRPERRPTPSQYLKCAWLRRPAVTHLQTLEDWSVTGSEDKASFLRAEAALALPRDARVHKLSSLLLRDIEMALSAAAAGGGSSGSHSGSGAAAGGGVMLVHMVAAAV